MENYVRIVREDDKPDKMTEGLNNNNTPWDPDKSISYDDVQDLGVDLLDANGEPAPEKKKRVLKRVRSIIRPEDVGYNDLNASEAKEFEESQKAKYIKPEHFLYRQIAKPSLVFKDGFSCLSDEIILGVFKYLSHEDLKYVAQVNQRFRRLSCDESLWPRIDLAGKMLNSNSLAYILKRGVKVLRLKEATIKTPIWEESVGQTLNGFQSRIELLDLSYCVSSPKDLALLLSKCRNLRKLSLESCEVTVEVAEQIGCDNMYLDTLNLAMVEGLNAQSIKIISTCCKRLQHVNLAWTKLSKEAVNIFVDNVSKNLLSLNLSGLGFCVTNSHIKTLIQRCPRLIDLDISDCVDVTSAIIPEIAESLPNIKSLAISRCYKIDPKVLICNLEKMQSLISLTAFRVIGSIEAKELETKYSLLRVNKEYYSTIARPTVGVRRTSIWQVRCRE